MTQALEAAKARRESSAKAVGRKVALAGERGKGRGAVEEVRV